MATSWEKKRQREEWSSPEYKRKMELAKGAGNLKEIEARGAQTRQTDMQRLRFNRDNMTAGQRAENLSYRERTDVSRQGNRLSFKASVYGNDVQREGNSLRRTSGVATPKGMSTKDQLAVKKYNDSLTYIEDESAGTRTLHPGMAVLNRINKSKDIGKAIADLSPEDRVLYDQGREIAGNMMSLDTPVQDLPDRGTTERGGAMGRVGGVGAYGAQRPELPAATRAPSYGRMGRLSDRGSNLANFSRPMDGEMSNGSYSSNRARRLAGERRSGYLQSRQSSRDAYTNRNVAFDRENPEYAGMPSQMMEPGWSPGSRFHQAGSGGHGIVKNADGSYGDSQPDYSGIPDPTGKSPKPRQGTNYRTPRRWNPMVNQSRYTPQRPAPATGRVRTARERQFNPVEGEEHKSLNWLTKIIRKGPPKPVLPMVEYHRQLRENKFGR